MPITGRTADECFDRFREHVSDLVREIIPGRPHLYLRREGALKATLSFWEHGPVAAPIQSNRGRIYLYLGQTLAVIEQPDADDQAHRFRLSTIEYMYRLQRAGDYKAKAFLRWEREPKFVSDGYCRHHVQMQAWLETTPDDKTTHLNKLHLPTGWILMEQVFRFLIADLGISPPCGDRWPAILTEGERRFFEDFTSKRYVPPAPPAGA